MFPGLAQRSGRTTVSVTFALFVCGSLICANATVQRQKLCSLRFADECPAPPFHVLTPIGGLTGVCTALTPCHTAGARTRYARLCREWEELHAIPPTRPRPRMRFQSRHSRGGDGGGGAYEPSIATVLIPSELHTRSFEVPSDLLFLPTEAPEAAPDTAFAFQPQFVAFPLSVGVESPFSSSLLVVLPQTTDSAHHGIHKPSPFSTVCALPLSKHENSWSHASQHTHSLHAHSRSLTEGQGTEMMPTVTPFGETKTASAQQDWWTLLHPIRLAMDSLSTHEMFMNNTPQVAPTGAQSVPYTVSPHMTPMNKDSVYPPTAQSTAAKSPAGYDTTLSDSGLALPTVAQGASEQALGVPPPSAMPPAQASVPLPAQHPSATQTRQTVCAPCSLF